MTPDVLIKKLLAQREFWVEVAPGKRIKLRRPAELEMLDMVHPATDGQAARIGIGWRDVGRYAVDWEGFSEADLIPSGAADAVPFDAELFAVFFADKRDWCARCAEDLVERVLAHLETTGKTQGN